MSANRMRGEAMVAGYVLRPSFENLVAAEEELGSLFALVERAAEGNLKLGQLVGLFWHCRDQRDEIPRDEFGRMVMEAGLAAATPALKTLLRQILSGR